MARKELNTGYAIEGVQVHPFTYVFNHETSYIVALAKSINSELNPTLEAVKIRVPVLAKSMPKPSPSNWIELGDEFEKKVGLESFMIPVLHFSIPVTTKELRKFLTLLFDPDSVQGIDERLDRMSFVKSPSVELLLQILDFTDALLHSQQFIPAIVPTDARPTFGTASWKSILSKQDSARVRSIIESGPAEFFSYISTARGSPNPTPGDILHFLVDSLVDTSVRRALDYHQHEFGFDDLQAKPLDEFLRLLSDPSRSTYESLSTRGRVPEVLEEWRNRVVQKLEPAHLAMRLSPPGLYETTDETLAENYWEVALGLAPADGSDEFIDGISFANAIKELELLELTPASAELLFLRKMTQAATHSAEISTLLSSARLTRFYLESEQVLEFVGKTSSALAALEGVTLILPAVLRDSIRPRIRVTSKPIRSGNSLLGRDAIFSFDAKVHLGDRELDASEIRKLIKADSPVVKLDSGWIFVDQDGLHMALRYLEKHKNQRELTFSELLSDTIDDFDQSEMIEIERPDPNALIEMLRIGRSMGPIIFSEPEGFPLPLREYQKRGVEWLASLEQVGLGACLADDMGLGKTAQIIALLAMERDNWLNQFGVTPGDETMLGPSAISQDGLVDTFATLIIAPVSVVNNWRREIVRFFPSLKVHIHHGTRRLEGLEFIDKATGVDVFITSYSLLNRDIGLLSAIRWKRVVLDEAQNIKNSTTNVSRAAVSLKAHSRIALTGTPVENHTGELWSIMNFINPHMFGSLANFRNKFSIPIERDKNEMAIKSLARAVSPFILRRLKTDKSIVPDLPEKIEVKEYCGLSDRQLILYQAAVDQLRDKLSQGTQMQRRGAILASIMRLKQICNHPNVIDTEPGLVGNSVKLDRLEQILEEILDRGEKAIIFTQFAVFGKHLQHHLQERLSRRVLYLNGEVPMTRRDEMVTEFQSANGPEVFVLSLKAGGTGLNLTAANHVIHFDRWWNSAVETQATDRAFRIGQRKDVVVTKLICEGTLEEKIDTIIETKRQLAENLISGGEAWITEMSDDEVLELLTLGSID